MVKPAVAVLAAGLGTRFGGNKLEAPCAGTVAEIKVKEGEAVDEGRVVVVLTEG